MADDRDEPDDDLALQEVLATYASGAAAPGTAILVRALIEMSPRAAAQVSAFERLGGALLREADAEAMAPGAFDRVLAMVGEGGVDAAAPLPADPLPAPVRALVDGRADAIQWRRRLPGVWDHRLDGLGDEEVMLLRARPGAAIPHHGHEGSELTLVFAGRLADGGRLYERGDVSIATDETVHKPAIVGETDCYCLAVSSGAMRFTGRFMRALSRLAD